MTNPLDPQRFLRPDANDRFRDGLGRNQFSDDASPNSSSVPSENAPDFNAYAAPADSASPLSGELVYETTQQHRGFAVLIMGLLGFLGAVFGSLGLFCCLPLPTFALALSVPACFMGRADLMAMKSGVMQSDNGGRGMTLWGLILGAIGTIWGGLVTLGIAVMLVRMTMGM